METTLPHCCTHGYFSKALNIIKYPFLFPSCIAIHPCELFFPHWQSPSLYQLTRIFRGVSRLRWCGSIIIYRKEGNPSKQTKGMGAKILLAAIFAAYVSHTLTVRSPSPGSLPLVRPNGFKWIVERKADRVSVFLSCIGTEESGQQMVKRQETSLGYYGVRKNESEW